MHDRVTHSEKVWRTYDVHTKHFHPTNHVDLFWNLFKVSVRWTSIRVLRK